MILDIWRGPELGWKRAIAVLIRTATVVGGSVGRGWFVELLVVEMLNECG